MATILLVEDGATVSRQVSCLLETAGHRVVRCGGGPTPLAACLLLRYGRCPLVDSADLVVFACALALPLPGRSYRGIHLLRAYRAHPDYGRLPLMLVAVAPPHHLAGAGPIEVVETHTDSAAVVAAANRLLQPTGQTPDRPSLATTARVVQRIGERDDSGGVRLWSSSRSLAETMPVTSPATTTGRCRTPYASILQATTHSGVSRSTTAGCEVMYWPAVQAARSRRSATARTMSRSVMTPARR
jgi:CheY-like chemotaxis protein